RAAPLPPPPRAPPPPPRGGRAPSASRDSARRTDRCRRGAAPPAFRAAAASARCRPDSCLAAPRPEQVRLDQVVQVAVHDGVDVAHLVAGPVILDQLVRMERVRADLAA